MLSSCRIHRQVVQHSTTDSTAVSFREVEKIVRIPGDTVVLVMPVKVQPSTNSGTVAYAYTPSVQTAETKRSSVRLEISKSGEIKATAICKELEEKVTVLEKTISNYKSEVTEYQVKESRFNEFKAAVWRWVKGILFLLLLIAVVATAFKLGFNPISILKKLIYKS
jgi:hypothetical protein